MTDAEMDLLDSLIRDVPDFPKPGIIFKDITPLLLDPAGFKTVVDAMIDAFSRKNVDKVLAIESRGFLFGGPVALGLKTGLVPARKEGKLPWQRRRLEYELEYGTDALEMHFDAIEPGERVLIIDDVLATGGTARAASLMVEQAGGTVVGLAFLIELAFLEGRNQLDDRLVWSALSYPLVSKKSS